MIVTLDNLAMVQQQHTKERIVLTSGTFDLLHVGHLHYLDAVKAYGDILVVLLSGDTRVKARKGDARPIIPENDRAEMLDALKVVDYVLIDSASLADDPRYAEILSTLQPDFYVTDGPDPRFWNVLERPKFVILDRAGGGQHTSTSAIIEHIQGLPRELP